MTTFHLFVVAERIELASAALYTTLARQFAGDAEAQALFSRLEAEENQHAARVRMLASQYRVDPKLVGSVGSVGGVGVLEGCEFQVQAALAEVRAGAWGRDLAGVKARLVLLEEALADAHAQALAREANPALRAFLRQLSEQDAAHRDLLRSP